MLSGNNQVRDFKILRLNSDRNTILFVDILVVTEVV